MSIYEDFVKREKRHKLLETAALQIMVNLREEGLLESGHAVCVSTFDKDHEDPDSYQFVKVVTEFKREDPRSS